MNNAWQMQLFVAEQALLASMDGVEIQGRGGPAWELFKARAQMVRQLRQKLAALDSGVDLPESRQPPETAPAAPDKFTARKVVPGVRDTLRIYRSSNRHDAPDDGGRTRGAVQHRA